MPALVINQITDLTPQHSINPSYINIPNNITLADPQFYDPSEVHLLIGAGVFFNLMGSGQIKGNKGQPFLQQTKLGWVISGSIPAQSYCNHSNQSSCFLLSADPLQDSIEKFWKIEENYTTIPSKYTKEEEECELHFQSTTIRDDTGRFQVSLPLKPQISQLGDSYDIALKRFLSIERKLQKNSILKQAYGEFMS
ncbi:uncharacterized protein [Diabrotica undecimpunctata]|uniref:uncharacterized protein n=1 Tax=Diabrotica undecimpunctata TaxID=50387 RepID=UPI003B63FAC0